MMLSTFPLLKQREDNSSIRYAEPYSTQPPAGETYTTLEYFPAELLDGIYRHLPAEDAVHFCAVSSSIRTNTSKQVFDKIEDFKQLRAEIKQFLSNPASASHAATLNDWNRDVVPLLDRIDRQNFRAGSPLLHALFTRLRTNLPAEEDRPEPLIRLLKSVLHKFTPSDHRLGMLLCCLAESCSLELPEPESNAVMLSAMTAMFSMLDTEMPDAMARRLKACIGSCVSSLIDSLEYGVDQNPASSIRQWLKTPAFVEVIKSNHHRAAQLCGELGSLQMQGMDISECLPLLAPLFDELHPDEEWGPGLRGQACGIFNWLRIQFLELAAPPRV